MTTPMLKHLLASLAEDVPAGIVRQIRDWSKARQVFTTEGEPVSWADVRVPLLAIAGSLDWLAGPDDVRALTDGVSSPDCTLEVLGRAQGLPWDFGHGGLLLSDPAPDHVFPRILRWLEARAERSVEAGPSDSTDNGVRHPYRGA
ncbi:MAG: hypothetical protein HC923_06160 [Myxococcales bacterium]|nr:hypothetical protein [Myxococcales bacterium]